MFFVFKHRLSLFMWVYPWSELRMSVVPARLVPSTQRPLLIYVCPVASKLDLLCVFEKYCFRLCFLKGSFKNFRFLFKKSFILHCTYYPNIVVSRKDAQHKENLLYKHSVNHYDISRRKKMLFSSTKVSWGLKVFVTLCLCAVVCRYLNFYQS